MKIIKESVNKSLTVNDLANACKEEIMKGNGNKYVLVSSDDEGNSYHTLFFLFVDDQELITKCAEYGLFHDNNDPNDVILLG